MSAFDDFSFDIAEIPFSRRGAWLDLSRVVALHTVADDLHLVTHTGGMHAVLRLEPRRDGRPAATDVRATPGVLTWSADGGLVEAAFDDAGIRFRGRGLGLAFVAPDELTPFTGAYLFVDPLDGSPTLTSYESGRRYRFTVLRGEPEVVGAERVGVTPRAIAFGSDDDWEVLVEELETSAPAVASVASFDAVVEARRAEFHAYSERLLTGTPFSVDVKACYVMWSATVSPAGFVTREAVLMSKHWMDKVWSWDHCFNAIALAAGDPQAALDQFLLPFDHRDATGALPDSITHSEVLYNFVKPPIHGWAFAQLRARAPRPFERAQLEEVHAGLAAWTRFWLRQRRAPGHALPYYQHGNDSGWDNSTTFDHGGVIESPDLAAFLVLQLGVLAQLSEELGLPASEWIEAESEVRTALFREFWTGSGFIARSVATGDPAPATSLLNSLPIVLGEQLPEDVADRLAASITRHLTEWGPATEPVDSPLYEDDGYWRGPIWAPSTMLIEDGLRRAGHRELADRIARSFAALCDTSGFAENFDARTGAGLRDRAYSWTASAYLTLRSDALARAESAILAGAE
ncbi:MGH1-like glycoside hydrolase domain-containing protein [Leifsonia shinshuensis]|uniref:amylo-alpha-1,6-glucosidase n=1 Tax=Leifsonia shinshuensis TaxID=150026 RepID=UPI002866B55A|nr:glycogen debranching protein [Leifsonia shinshuensis]MDR6972946.1 glycogen debranching enzyme [Leifsonia shinshuensis]